MDGLSTITTLQITRPKIYMAMGVSHKIFVDGKEVGELHNGETSAFSIPAGRHIVSVRQDWVSHSNPLPLHCFPAQTIRLQVRQNNPALQFVATATWVGLLLLRRRNNLRLERMSR